MRNVIPLAWLSVVTGVLLPTPTGFAAQVGDVFVCWEDYDGPAQLAVRRVEKHKLRIDIDPKTETDNLVIRVELPNTGRNAWSAADVEFRDTRGEAVLVRRSGIEWHKLLIPVAAVRNTYVVQTVPPPYLHGRRRSAVHYSARHFAAPSLT